jgi:hypothetical protein
MWDGFNGLLGMLILAFPEVRWRFIWERLPSDENIPYEQARINLLYSWQANETDRLDSWSDGQALREYVRGLVRPELEDRTSTLPVRPNLAVAVDDEPDFALFHAYTAYRFGFQACAVWRDAGMKYFFGKDAEVTGVDRVIEDLTLEFSDQTAPILNTRYSKKYSESAGKCRETQYPKLNADKLSRIFVSYDTSKVDSIPENCRKVDKPCQGIYDLAKQAGLSENGAPSPKGNADSPVVQSEHHSVPGRLAEVARHMLARADRILNGRPIGMQKAVLAASLALDAGELVGDKVPTIALEALRLRHMAEVFAECHFSGIQYNLAVTERLRDIEDKVKSACWVFKPSNREKAEKNGEMMVLLDVVKILREHGQFDEAIECQNRIRKLHTALKFLDRTFSCKWLGRLCRNIKASLGRIIPWLGNVLKWVVRIWRTLGYLLYQYADFAFSSIVNFVLGFASWMAIFLFGFWLLALPWHGRQPSMKAMEDIGPWEQAFTAMTGANFFSSYDLIWNIWTVFAVVVGLVHLGLLIALLYMHAVRKE